MAEVVIHDGNFLDFCSPIVDGERKSHGGIPRNYSSHPVGYLMYARPFDIPLIPQDKQQDILDARIAAKAQLSDVRNTGMFGSPIPSRDQNGKGYCWAHSSTSAALIARAINNEPYKDLSAYAIACMIKNFQDQGGWGAESVEFFGKRGCPTSEYWPQQSMSRANDKPETWADAAHNTFAEWMDLEPRNIEQYKTCLLLGMPVVADFNWWSHSVCAVDLVSINPFRVRIWNSWGDSWSENGMGILEGQKAIPDGALAIRVMKAAA